MIPVLGTEALVCYQVHEGEHTRRLRAGAGAILSPDVLELLLGLPVAMPVRVSSLTRHEREVLRSAPAGAVSVEDGNATRHAVAPVTVRLALIVAPSWRHGLEVAGRFAPFCARAMVLRRPPGDVNEVRLQADFYGVGVIVVDDMVTEVLVEPTPFQRVRFTAASWWFLEHVYRHGR
ncbi:MAG TPA: hypothetical protein VFC19_09550 [Candidatus Limnocylindrales bacterium]|nr:hypothetical protein [Candidatus Limnocylindrales bacterium]